MDILAMLLADGYKHTHHEQFSPGTTKLVSYLTPRKSRLKSQNEMILFGLQAFCKEYLIDYFNYNFFYEKLDDVIKEYSRVLDTMFGKGVCNIEKIEKLHKLGGVSWEDTVQSLEERRHRTPREQQCSQNMLELSQ